MLEARGVVGHDVGFPWEEMRLVTVSVLALVATCIIAEMRGRSFSGGGAFEQARQARGVVRTGGNGPAADVVAGDHHRQLAVDSCLLEVTIRNRPVRVILGD